MSNAKRSLKALGLSLLAAMGLMAFLAAGAQAAWDLDSNLKEITSSVTVGGNFVAGQEGLLLVKDLNLVIHCKKFKVETGSVLLPLPALIADANLQYEECISLVKGVSAPECKPEILLVKASLEPILHNSEVYILAKPQSGLAFTTVHTNEDTCALPPLPTVTGSVVFECYQGELKLDDCKKEKVTHLIKPAAAALFPSNTLKYGLNAAEIDGEVEVFLTGPDSGKLWNALV